MSKSRVSCLQFGLILAAVGLTAPACSLPTPTGAATGDGGALAVTCANENAVVSLSIPDAGTTVVTADAGTVVTPTACSGAGKANPNAIDKYSQGYGHNDPMIQTSVDTAMKGFGGDVSSEIEEMYGEPFIKQGKVGQFFDTQRSQDVAGIRGYRYRDASRGVNFGEDMDGNPPGKHIVQNQSVGYSTSFPVSMARGAAFDLDLEYAVGEAIADEMQAANQTLLLAPCMNLLRHPYWGRAQETYGEDSFHVGRLSAAMVVGIQQHIAANAKHYLAYDIEVGRSKNDSSMDEQTLREIYGRHFRMVVQDSGVSSVMASYNSVNGTKSTQNGHNLTEILRKDFGFQGFVLSDWWAMPGDSNTSTPTSVLQQNAINALDAGLDVELPWGFNYGQLANLYNSGKVTKDKIDTAVKRVLYEKFRFNSAGEGATVGLGTPTTAYDYQGGQICGNLPHLALAKKAALESMVLLKNDGVLPISPSAHNIVVVGATVPYVINTTSSGKAETVNFATDVRGGDLGSSRVYPDPAKSMGPVDGICLAAGGTPDVIKHTCNGASVTWATNNQGDISPITNAVGNADFVVVMAGLTAQDEGEEYTLAGDRDYGVVPKGGNPLLLDTKQQDSTYQGIQNKLISAVAMTGKPMVVVLEGGSVIEMPWLGQVHALVMAWYPGQRGGEALGDLLFGQVNGVSYNFGGKLPFTWGTNSQYAGITFSDTSGSTKFDYYIGYRYFDHNNLTPTFPFGAGMSYTSFELSNPQLGCSSLTQGGVLPVVVDVKNTGMVDGDETVMVFVSFPNTTVDRRKGQKELKGFARVSLKAGETKQVTVPVRLSDLDYFKMDSPTGNTGHWVVEDGPIKIMVGDSSTNLPLTVTLDNVKGYTVGSSQ